MCTCKRTPCVHSLQSFVRSTAKAARPDSLTDDAILLASIEDGWGEPAAPQPAPADADKGSRPRMPATSPRDAEEDRLPTRSDFEDLRVNGRAVYRIDDADASDAPITPMRVISVADETETPFLLTLRKMIGPRRKYEARPAR
jgi:hypothetical protein